MGFRERAEVRSVGRPVNPQPLPAACSRAKKDRMSARVKSELWVAAQIRLCDRLAVQAVVVRKGDPDSGAILVRVEDSARNVVVWTQVHTGEGERAWMRGTGPVPVSSDEAEKYVRRAIERDYDIWILDIDDPQGRYRLDGAQL